MPTGEPDRAAARSTFVADSQPADTVLGSIHDQVAAEASQAITDLYHAEYRSLVRMSAVLVGDVSTAEEVVQDTFIAMHSAWRRLRHSDKAVNYLRRSVMNRSRSVLRHRAVADRHAPKPEPDMPSAEQGAIAQLERSAVISALLCAAAPAARGARAQVLPGPVGRSGRLDDAHQPGRGEEPHRPGQGGPAHGTWNRACDHPRHPAHD